MEPRPCLRCDVPMEPGYVPDAAYGEWTLYLAKWVTGVPERSLWTGGVKRRQGLPVVALRCPACGGIELVAPEESTT